MPYLCLLAVFVLDVFFALPFSSAQTTENELHIGKFSSADQTGWKEQTVFGAKKTAYTFTQENGKTILKAKSSDSAAGLIHKVNIDSKTHPLIKWSWKIDHTLKKANERTKEGHDFAARLYVVFPRGLFAKTRAIEYVWGNVMHKGESIKNPYSDNMVMIAVDAGDELAGQWVFHTRNFAEDYRAAFGEEAPKVGAIAVMTDSDNTHDAATGYYGDITVLPAPKEEGQKPREPKHKEQPPKEQPSKEPQPKEQQKKEQTQKGRPNGNSSSAPVAAPSLKQ